MFTSADARQANTIIVRSMMEMWKNREVVSYKWGGLGVRKGTQNGEIPLYKT